ncbi:MAG TPA: HEAT repeat domain-containing protein, partial [Gammaproteobacteria bacterium]|nr:HEAT repeat domain-containing protein [Gammaproteobacteria bacterium]
QAKLRLMDLPKADATAATQKWIDGLKLSDPDLEHKLYEAIGVFESHEVINRRLLDRLLDAKDYRARAYATRVAGRWHDRLDDPLAILGRRARDEHIRVRLEAVVAASDVRQPKSILVAAHAGANDSDRFVKFAFNQTVHALANHWRPALLSGDLTFANTDHLQAVLKVYGGNDVAGVVRQQIDNPKLPVKQRQALFALLAQTGNTTDAQLILKSANTLPDVLDALSESVQKRNLQPPPNAEKQLFAATRNRNRLVRAKAIQLAGLWKINSFKDYIITEATDQNEPANVRLAATEALAQLGGDKAIESLDRLAVLTEPASVRAAAISGLAKLDLPKAAKHSAELLTKVNEIELGSILAAILKRNEGADALA